MEKQCSGTSSYKYCNIEKNMYCNTKKICIATSKNMYYNIEKICIATSKIICCNIENYVLQHLKQ
jgi:hypothetical protein